MYFGKAGNFPGLAIVIILLTVFFLSPHAYAQTPSLLINEIMANKDSDFQTRVQPPVGDPEWVSPDWIEIHNTTGTAVNINGWYLSDNENDLTKWQFPLSPAISIPAGGYLVVFASGKMEQHYPDNYPYVDLDGYYHTNFQLDRGGEFLALVMPDGVTIAHQYNEYPSQRGFISYGYCENTGEYGYFRTPTPGAANSSSCLTQVVGDTKFDFDRGFYDSPFYVAIVTDTPDATIRYTTDGSTPTPTHGTIYPGPPGVHITTTTTLRALAYKNDYLETNVDTQTYIFLVDVIHQPFNPPGFPLTGWGHELPDYEMDPAVVDDPCYSNTIKDDLKSLPTLSLVMNVNNWFNTSPDVNIGGIYSNPDWEDIYDDQAERVVSVEFFDPCDQNGFQLDSRIRIVGGTSTENWKCDKLSMRLKFREPDGPTKLNFKLFKDPHAIDSFDTLVLEARHNTSWAYKKANEQNDRAQYTRDQYVSDLHNSMGGYSPHGRYVHLYINGLYWGIYNIHERPDEAYAAPYNQGDKDDFHALKPSNEGDGYIILNNGYNQSALASFNELLEAADDAGNNPDNLAKWEIVKQKLDVDNLIDYLLARWYVGDGDFCNNYEYGFSDFDSNWYATAFGNPAGPSKWRFHCWDAEKCLYDVDDNTIFKCDDDICYFKCPADLHGRLMHNKEYKLLFADHIHRHLFNNGMLTVNRARQLYQHRLNIVTRAVVAESARWGDNRRSVPYTRNIEWIAERDRLLNEYFPNRHDYFMALLNYYGFYPSTDAPLFSQYGGHVAPNYKLTITNPGSGTIWYTTNGQDPRLPGGAINPNATIGNKVTLTQSTNVQARVLNGSTWSALTEATFAIGPVAQNLRITEIMYNPIDPCTEFIELQNVSSVDSINLNYVSFTNGIDYTFSSVILDPCAFILLVKNPTAFAAQYPSVPSGIIKGPYQGKLANDGEQIRLEDAAQSVIHDFRYKDGWYDLTDSQGFSLTIIDPVNTDPCNWSLKESWLPSTDMGGSPGRNDHVIPKNAVVINEILAHSSDGPDWIELYNQSIIPVNIGGWFLSDDGKTDAELMKFEIPADTWIPGGGYVVFYQNEDFTFGISENGETVYLSSGQNGQLGGYRNSESFGPSQPNVAKGRYFKASTGTYNFVDMSENTPGQPNAYPNVGPIVIDEIMYNPPDPGQGSAFTDNEEFEYIKLLNISDHTVTLQEYDNDLGVYVPWKFTDGIDFTFPNNPAVTVPSGGHLIIARNPAAFAERYPNVPSELILGPYSDTKLSNSGEQLQIGKPADMDPNTGEYYYIRVDRVNYSDGSHPAGEDLWPIGPDGNGKALHRRVAADYGNDVLNWQAVTPDFSDVKLYYPVDVQIIGGGSVTIDPSEGPYPENTQLLLTAVPDPSWHLDSWTNTDNDSSQQLTNTVTVDSAKSVTVVFSQTAYTLTVKQIGTGGTLSLTSGTYSPDTVETISVTLKKGYYIKSWQGTDDDSSTLPYNTVTIDGPKNVTVTIAAKMSLSRCQITAGFQPGKDSILLSGQLPAAYNEIVGGNYINVTISSSQKQVYQEAIPFTPPSYFYSTGSYIYSGTPGGVTLFILNVNQQSFLLMAQNINLGGLTSPVNLEITLGDFVGTSELNESIINGSRPIPIRLLRGHADALRVSTARVFSGFLSNTDSLLIQGEIVVKDDSVNLTTEELLLIWDNQNFTIPAQGFRSFGNKTFFYQGPTRQGANIITAILDMQNCTFRFFITRAAIATKHGAVDIGIHFGDFDETTQFVAP